MYLSGRARSRIGSGVEPAKVRLRLEIETRTRRSGCAGIAAQHCAEAERSDGGHLVIVGGATEHGVRVEGVAEAVLTDASAGTLLRTKVLLVLGSHVALLDLLNGVLIDVLNGVLVF